MNDEANQDAAELMAYIARAACGCIKFVGVDTPTNAKTIAKAVAWAIRQGYTVEQVTCAAVREHFVSSCAICGPPKRTKIATIQERLL